MKRKRLQTDSVELTIEALAAGGDGIACRNDRTYFVPQTAPGDTVVARCPSETGKTVQCQLDRIITGGPHRVSPSCPLAGKCGGCDWQHVDYASQLGAKNEVLRRALRLSDVAFTPSAAPLGYRRLARLHFTPLRNGSSVLGFNAPHGHHIIPIEDCPVLVQSLRDTILPLMRGPLRHLRHPAEVLLSAGTNGAFAHIRTDAPLNAAFYDEARALVPAPLSGMEVMCEGILGHVAGEGNVEVIAADGKPLLFPLSSFGQANAEINELLSTRIAQWIADCGPFERALELFAGAGNFSVMISPLVSRLTICELDSRACATALSNLRSRESENVTVQQGDAVDVYRRLGHLFDLVILDPPRTGAEELVQLLKNSRHRAVLYVSCNPVTLARDLRHLEAGGFRMSHAAGFDMFPQTRHMEAAVLLER